MRISFAFEHKEYADIANDYISRIKEFARIGEFRGEGTELRFVVSKKKSGKVFELTSTELAEFVGGKDIRVSVSALDEALAFADACGSREVALVRLVNIGIPVSLGEALAAEQVYRALMINAGRKYHK